MPLVVGLAEDEHRRDRHRDQAEDDAAAARLKRAQPGRRAAPACTRRMPRNAQFSSAPESSAETDATAPRCARRAARCAAAPGPSWCRSRPGGSMNAALQPAAVAAARRALGQVARAPADGSPRRARGGDGEEEVAQQRQGDADRADQQVLPGRLERAVVAVEVDQRRAGQRRRLDRDPQQARGAGSAITSVIVARNSSRQPVKIASGRVGEQTSPPRSRRAPRALSRAR